MKYDHVSFGFLITRSIHLIRNSRIIDTKSISNRDVSCITIKVAIVQPKLKATEIIANILDIPTIRLPNERISLKFAEINRIDNINTG
jgi:hypothetical protein